MKKKNNNHADEWFKNWFDENYEIVYGHRDDAEAEQFVSSWPIDWAPLRKQRALDLGCGNGRFCRALARREMKVIGIDTSAHLLSRAISSEYAEFHADYIRGDLRDLPFNGKFGIITSLFTSFGYFDTDKEHVDALGGMVELLAPGGILVLDLPNRDCIVSEVEANPSSIRDSEGYKILEIRAITDDRSRVTKEIEIISKNETAKYFESVRLFSAEELLSMCSNAGIAQIAPLWGNYEGGSLNQTNPRMVFFGRKYA